MPIRVLSPEVAGKIAAGEVVERPASVVKELIENSIDAEADSIQIEVREGGRRLIRLADNGCGIAADEIALAFARHATSKLSSVDDLDRITTLGFRGEALASIAAVSQVTVLTRPPQQAVGQFVQVEAGQITRREGRGCPAGTVVTVEHLFRNVPARLKFLRQPQTELGHIYAVVSHYALAHPHIRLGLTSDGRQVFQSSGNAQTYDVLIAVHGLEVAEKMLPLDPDDPDGAIQLSGYVGLPALHRATRQQISLFVNRRWIQDRSLLHAVVEAYHTLLPVGRHPVALLFVSLDPSQVDVNVHPAKREVKFRDGRRVYGAVQRSVRHTLLRHAPVPDLAFTGRAWPAADWERRQDLVSARSSPAAASQWAMELYAPGRAEQDIQPVGPVRLPLLRVVGQVGQTYIVAEGPQGLYLIDQHAAHERVLYEQMLAEWQGPGIASQRLLEPHMLDLDPLLAGTLAEYQAQLERLGFDVEPFGGTSYLLRAVPAVLAASDLLAATVDILETLRLGSDSLAAQAEGRLIAAVCKRAAVKAGQSLSSQEMQELVRRLEQCQSPRTCPHGRPTVLHFSAEQLEREFGRR